MDLEGLSGVSPHSIGCLLRKKQSSIMTLESMLATFDRTLRIQRSYRSLIGVKEVDRPTYEIHGDYKRFNQKYSLGKVVRGAWDPLAQKIIKNIKDKRKLLAERGTPGYTLVERSLADAAEVITRSDPNTDFPRYPNLGFLSWSPLRKPTHEAIGLKRLEIADEKETAGLIKKVALWFGASLVGIALLDRRWVYSHWYDDRVTPNRNPPIVFSDEVGFEQYFKPTELEDGTHVIPKEMKYAVVLGFEEDYESVRTAPTAIAQAGTDMYGYRKIVQTTCALAEFIRGLGFNAIPSSGDTALNIPLAIDAGLGEDGRHTLLLTPEYGPRLRLGKVITDLPLATDKPITFGVHEFCKICRKCADNCPGKAITLGPRTTGVEKNDVDSPTISETVGPLRWIRNAEKCYAYDAEIGTNCGVCIRVCPWNKPQNSLHSFSKWLAINGGSLTRHLLVRLDNTFGYGKSLKPSDWWIRAKHM
jgi:epoxyqueuosine reductase